MLEYETTGYCYKRLIMKVYSLQTLRKENVECTNSPETIQ